VSGLPVGLYAQGSAGNALAAALEASRAGADLIAAAVYPVALTMHRVGAESVVQALSGIGMNTGVDLAKLWEASDLVDEHIGDQPVPPLVPTIAVRAAQRKLPVGLVAALSTQLRAQASADRLDEVLEEVQRVREEAGSPPLAAPIGEIVATQALINVLTASRYSTMVDELRDLVTGKFGRTPGPVDPALTRAVELLANGRVEPEPVDLEALREEAQGLASSEEELLLLALFGDDAEPLLRALRERAGGDESLAAGGVDQAYQQRIRDVVRIVQETGVGEITIEEDGLRVSVRRSVEPMYAPQAVGMPAQSDAGLDAPPLAPRNDAFVRVESPMVGTFYRAPAPGAAPFVEEGDAVAPGQTLCILEAMKLMNEVKAEIEGVVRAIHVDNAQPVEYGQLLFELEPIAVPAL
jgi:oxaloacetate decarboxylase alpha subunit